MATTEHSPSELYILLRDCEGKLANMYEDVKSLVNEESLTDADVEAWMPDLETALDYIEVAAGHVLAAVKERVVNKDFVPFGDVARNRIGMQCQYASRYLNPKEYPDISHDTRWKGDIANYHEIYIHKDDVESFVSRVLKYLHDNHIR